MASKRQTTMAKLTRERLVQERREKKREKKLAAAAARNAQAAEGGQPVDTTPSEALSEPGLTPDSGDGSRAGGATE